MFWGISNTEVDLLHALCNASTMNAKSFDVGIVNCGELNVDIYIELAMVRYCILRRKPFQAFLQKTSTTTDSGCCSHCLS